MSNTEHSAREQQHAERSATAVLDWVRRHYANEQREPNDHSTDAFHDGYLYALDIVEQALEYTLRITESFPGVSIHLHDDVHENAAKRADAHTERPSTAVDSLDSHKYWLASLRDLPGSEHVAINVGNDLWLMPGVTTRTLHTEEIEIVAPLLRADQLSIEDDYRLAPWESVDGQYVSERWTRHVTDWKKDA